MSTSKSAHLPLCAAAQLRKEVELLQQVNGHTLSIGGARAGAPSIHARVQALVHGYAFLYVGVCMHNVCVRVCVQLDHPNIVRLLNSYEHDGNLHIVR